MISLPSTLSSTLAGCKIKYVDCQGPYANKVEVSGFCGHAQTVEVVRLMWMQVDERNKTWIITDKNYRYDEWSHINLLHTMARDLVKLSLVNPAVAIANVLFIQHIFNAVIESAIHRKEVSDFIKNNNPIISFEEDSRLTKELSDLRTKNPVQYLSLLKKHTRKGDLKAVRLAYQDLGRLSPLYDIDPFPFDQGPVENIPAQVLLLTMKMKCLAWFLSDNIK